MAEQLSLWDLVGEEGAGGACSPDGMEPLRPADATPDASSEGAAVPDGTGSSRGADRTRAAVGLVPDTVTASGERRLAQGSEPVCGYVSVVVDVPSRALSIPSPMRFPHRLMRRRCRAPSCSSRSIAAWLPATSSCALPSLVSCRERRVLRPSACCLCAPCSPSAPSDRCLRSSPSGCRANTLPRSLSASVFSASQGNAARAQARGRQL